MQAFYVDRGELRTVFPVGEKVYKAADVEARLTWLEEGVSFLKARHDFDTTVLPYCCILHGWQNWLAREPKEG
ncbi:MAG: hypothetical protein AAB538_02705 [Patescibacteria group bacterium]